MSEEEQCELVPKSEDAREALESLCRVYWPAVYHYIRRAGITPEAAQDLAQGFFMHLVERNWLARTGPELWRFRYFLMPCLKRFLADRVRPDIIKNGGRIVRIPLDEISEEEGLGPELSTHATPGQEYDRDCTLAALHTALHRLSLEAEASGSGELFQSVKRYLGGNENEQTLQELGKRQGIGLGTLKMRIRRWRGRCRQLIREEVTKTLPCPADVD